MLVMLAGKNPELLHQMGMSQQVGAADAAAGAPKPTRVLYGTLAAKAVGSFLVVLRWPVGDVTWEMH